jgi:hypothetical protein
MSTMSPAKLFVLALVLIPMTAICGLADEPRVQDIPLPKDATDVSYMRKRGDIRFKVASDMKTAGNFYGTILKEQHWTKSGKDNLQKRFWVQTFAQKDRKLEVRVDQRETGCEIRLTPTGFAWDEDLAPRPKDLPIPEGAKELTYEDFFERIEFQSATPVDQLAEFYVNKLDAKTWVISGTDRITANSANLRRTSGKASVVIDIHHKDEFNEVKITTKGMVWDEIKAANALAKKSKEKSEDRDPGPSRIKVVVLPTRVEKPEKGIDKLERVASKCVITVDGKRVELSQIIAYECVSQGQWRTKVVASETALNQRVLLELLKTTATDEGWDLAPPFLKLELDDHDRPAAASLVAAKVPGSAAGDDLEGEAIVEQGRARGTVRVKPKKFFDNEYSAEMTFDVPLLTRESTPAKRLVNVAKLPSSGKLTLAGKTHSLSHVTIYETQQFDKVSTAVLLTEQPINMAKLKASLAKPARNDEDFLDFQTQIKLLFSDQEQLKSVFIYCDGLSINASGDDNYKASVVIEEGRIRGTAKTIKPGETFGKKFELDVSFDASVIALPAGKK